MSARSHNNPGGARLFHPGDPVKADFGGNIPGGPFVCFVFTGAHDTPQGVKHTIQAPDGSKHDLAYREPADRDEHGSGGTFWSV